MIIVVDTNVAVVANGGAPQASRECVLSCVRRLQAVTESGKLALDNKWRIISEYQQNLEVSGQPGVGWAFLK